MSTTMKPLFDKVLIKRQTLQDTLNTTLIIPDDAQKRNAPQTGVVLAIGEDVEQVCVGDNVLFGQHAGSFIKDEDDNELFIILDTDVLCIMEIVSAAVFEPGTKLGMYNV